MPAARRVPGPPRRARGRAGRGSGYGTSWFSLFIPFAGFFQERQHTLPLGPIAGAVLNDFLELDLGVRHVRDEAEVLAHVVALLHPVERLVGTDQRVHVIS